MLVIHIKDTRSNLITDDTPDYFYLGKLLFINMIHMPSDLGIKIDIESNM